MTDLWMSFVFHLIYLLNELQKFNDSLPTLLEEKNFCTTHNYNDLNISADDDFKISSEEMTLSQ